MQKSSHIKSTFYTFTVLCKKNPDSYEPGFCLFLDGFGFGGFLVAEEWNALAWLSWNQF